jgi:hypothetical protein
MVDPKALPLSGASTAKPQTGRRTGADALAAGVARASGERAKRRRTPLLVDPSNDGLGPRPALSSVDGRGAIRAHRPRPVPKSHPVQSAKTARSSGTQPQKEPVRR